MGKLRNSANASFKRFEVYLESQERYREMLQDLGFLIQETEIVQSEGEYHMGLENVIVKREFFIFISQKSV